VVDLFFKILPCASLLRGLVGTTPFIVRCGGSVNGTRYKSSRGLVEQVIKGRYRRIARADIKPTSPPSNVQLTHLHGN